jgi:hypothetical protein
VGNGGAPWWLGIVTALLAGGFALLGVRLTQRHAAQQRRLDRMEDHRAEQRAAIVELLAAGRTWAHTPEAAQPRGPSGSTCGPTSSTHVRSSLRGCSSVMTRCAKAAKNVSELANASPTLVRANLGVNDPEVAAVAVAAVDAYRDARLLWRRENTSTSSASTFLNGAATSSGISLNSAACSRMRRLSVGQRTADTRATSRGTIAARNAVTSGSVRNGPGSCAAPGRGDGSGPTGLVNGSQPYGGDSPGGLCCDTCVAQGGQLVASWMRTKAAACAKLNPGPWGESLVSSLATRRTTDQRTSLLVDEPSG